MLLRGRRPLRRGGRRRVAAGPVVRCVLGSVVLSHQPLPAGTLPRMAAEQVTSVLIETQSTRPVAPRLLAGIME
ncbi:hypothetical protein APASM_0114 [Actinosynnema pretiosum subsp. pretiosum]|nr:hypothetical protein APASM_0114 [Actinosynnema pretiosum subsp. pretiosum]